MKPILLKSPCLMLLAFHQQSDSSEASTAQSEWWQQWIPVGKQLNCPELCHLPSYLHDDEALSQLKQAGRLKLTFSSSEITGDFYLTHVHDTYVADCTLRFAKAISVEQLNELNPRHALTDLPASLGKTVILLATPTEDTELESLAKQCATALFNQPLPLATPGQLLGSPCFEFADDESTPITQRRHVLVWFNRHEKTESLAVETEAYLKNLLLSHHKILYVYDQAKQTYEAATTLYDRLEQAIKRFETLSTSASERQPVLDKMIVEMSKQSIRFAHYVRNLQDHQTTINTNSYNYDHSLQKMQFHCLPEDNIEFLQTFSTQQVARFQKQVMADLDYLKSGSDLFQLTITAIRGMTEIDTLKQMQQTEENEYERQNELEIFVALIASAIEGTAISIKANHDLPEILFPTFHHAQAAPFHETLFQHLLEIGVHFGYFGLPLGIVAVILVVLFQRFGKTKLWDKKRLGKKESNFP